MQNWNIAREKKKPNINAILQMRPGGTPFQGLERAIYSSLERIDRPIRCGGGCGAIVAVRIYEQNEHRSSFDRFVLTYSLNLQISPCLLQATRTKIPRIPATALTKAAGHARESESNVTRLVQAAKGVPSEDSLARAMRFVCAGVPVLPPEVDSVVPTNPSKSLYHRHRREDGTFEAKQSKEMPKMNKDSRYCW